MKNCWVSVAALVAALFMSCSSVPKRPAPMALHSLLPETFEVGFWGIATNGYVTLKLQNGYLVQKVVGEKIEKDEKYPAGTQYFTPSEADWLKFWSRMNELRVWDWKAEYNPEDVGCIVDGGGGWSLVLQWKGKAVQSKGMNAWPNSKDPKKTVLEDYHLLDALDLLRVSSSE